MKINTDLALIPVYQEIQPVGNIPKKNVISTDIQEERLVRISYSGSKSRRVGTIYDRMGDEINKSGQRGEHIDLYV
ncbi:MAG: hypothetical protein PVG39_00945 [Desulfobacteraceae bacterium]|jgi:hypothetical protein